MIRTTLAALIAASLALSGCSSSTTSSGGGGTTDTTTADDTVSDTTTGNDTVSGDTTADTGKDAGKDTVKADVGPPTASWGTCTISDTACMQGCVPQACSDAGSACQADKKCTDLQTCFQNCGKTPIVMPPQDATPVAQLPGETTDTYCQRVCEIQGGPTALAEDQAYIECVIGMCLDCATSATDGIPKASCQASCGLENYCLDGYNACINDADCVNTYGCMLSCASGDQACQTACQKAAPAPALALLKTWNDCETKYAKTCVAP